MKMLISVDRIDDTLVRITVTASDGSGGAYIDVPAHEVRALLDEAEQGS